MLPYTFQEQMDHNIGLKTSLKISIYHKINQAYSLQWHQWTSLLSNDFNIFTKFDPHYDNY